MWTFKIYIPCTMDIQGTQKLHVPKLTTDLPQNHKIHQQTVRNPQQLTLDEYEYHLHVRLYRQDQHEERHGVDNKSGTNKQNKVPETTTLKQREMTFSVPLGKSS